MATSSESTHFRQGAGRLCLEFIRTLRHRGTDRAAEELADPVTLIEWIRQFGPCDTDSPDLPTNSQVSEARRLREAIYELVTVARGTAGIRSCGGVTRRRINAAAAFPVPAPSMDASGKVRWHSDEPTPATLALVARDALDLASCPGIDRVRGCANPDCGALFFDSSRPGNRRWCSMDTCGNLAKKNTLRGKAGVT